VLETLRQYLQEVPVLAQLIERELLNHPANVTNTEDLRFHVEDLQQKLFARLKAERTPYAVVHFPEMELSCPACKESFSGYYWELNNPATGKGLCVSNRLIHALVAHEQFFITESLHNVAGTRVGDSRLVLDVAGLASVLKGSSAPAEIVAECEAAAEVQARQLAEAGEFVASGGGH
jgi:hypothetical protein